MTIERTISSVSYVGNGATTAFDFGFPIPSGCLLVLQRINGVESEVASSAYTVQGLDHPAGGRIIFAQAPASGVGLAISRRMELTQRAVFTTGQAFHPEVVENALDRQIMIAQQLAGDLTRTPKMSLAFAGQVDLTLPNPVGSRGLMWNGDGSGLKNSDVDLDVLAAQAPLAIAAGQSAPVSAAAALVSQQAAEQALRSCEIAEQHMMQTAQEATAGLDAAVSAAQFAQAEAEQSRSSADQIRIAMQSTVAAAVDAATQAAQASANAMVQAAQSAEAAASNAAITATTAAQSIDVQQVALEGAVASASASAVVATNAAAQVATVAWLLQTTDYGFVDGATTQSYDYGVLP